MEHEQERALAVLQSSIEATIREIRGTCDRISLTGLAARLEASLEEYRAALGVE